MNVNDLLRISDWSSVDEHDDDREPDDERRYIRVVVLRTRPSLLSAFCRSGGPKHRPLHLLQAIEEESQDIYQRVWHIEVNYSFEQSRLLLSYVHRQLVSRKWGGARHHKTNTTTGTERKHHLSYSIVLNLQEW